MVNDIEYTRINDTVMDIICCWYSISTKNANYDILKSVEEADFNMYLFKKYEKFYYFSRGDFLKSSYKINYFFVL